MVSALYRYRNHFICWPTEQELVRSATVIEAISGIPGIVGFVDASHIRITKPYVDTASYMNRKRFASLQLQVKSDFA